MAEMAASRCSSFSSGESAFCSRSMHLRIRSKLSSEGGMIFDCTYKRLDKFDKSFVKAFFNLTTLIKLFDVPKI